MRSGEVRDWKSDPEVFLKDDRLSIWASVIVRDRYNELELRVRTS